MFDFRYHALSLIAVFIALALGLLLGVAIGDKELVSSARQEIRDSLRADVREARDQLSEARDEIAAHERFERAAYPAIVGGRLFGRRIGLIALRSDDDLAENVEGALEQTGGRLTAVSVVRIPLRLDDLGGRASGTRFETLGDEPLDAGLVEDFGVRIGLQFVRGGSPGRLLQRVRRSLLSHFSGELSGLDGVVLVRSRRDLEGDDARAATAFEKGLIDGLTDAEIPVVGVEATDAESSQIGFFEDQGLSSVDNIDQLPGHVALAFALAGAEGSFGVKDTRDALLPRAVQGAADTR